MNIRFAVNPMELALILNILNEFDAKFYEINNIRCYTRSCGNLIFFQYKEEEDGGATVYFTLAPDVSEKLLNTMMAIVPAVKGIARTIINLGADIKGMLHLQKDKFETHKIMKSGEEVSKIAGYKLRVTREDD